MLVTTIHKPYSYVTTYDRFPQEVEAWDVSAPANISVHTIASLPLADRVPIHGVALGPRDFSWRPTEPATLLWAEALDGGDWNTEAPNRDKIMLAKAPFSGPPVEVTRTVQRYAGLRLERETCGRPVERVRPQQALAKDVRGRRGRSATKARLLWDLSTDELYKDPGEAVFRVLPNGARVIVQEGDSIYLRGRRALARRGPAVPRSTRISRRRRSERLFRSDKDVPTSDSSSLTGARRKPVPDLAPIADRSAERLHAHARKARRRSPRRARRRSRRRSAAITHIPDPTPAVRAIKKRLVKYKRKDGLDLSFTLYTPPDYKEGTRVPAILYAYPLDYADRHDGRRRSRGSRADLHAALATTGSCCWPDTPSSTTLRSRSSAIPRRRTTRTSSSSSPTPRRRSIRPSRSGSSIPIASASRGTATARS